MRFKTHGGPKIFICHSNKNFYLLWKDFYFYKVAEIAVMAASELPPGLFDRNKFISPTFSIRQFVDELVQRTLDPVINKSNGPSNLSIARNADFDSTVQNDETYRKVASELVGLMTTAVGAVQDLEAQATDQLARAEARCREVERTQKSVLVQLLDSLDKTSGKLEDVDSKLNVAAGCTIGVEKHMAQANNRVSRGRMILQLVQHFDSFSKLNVEELRSTLDTLSTARVVIRKRVTTIWSQRPTASGSFFKYDGGKDHPPQEAAAVAVGLPKVFANRLYTEQAVDWMLKLSALANELSELVSNAQNVDVYANWLQNEVVRESFHLIETFCDIYDKDPVLAASSLLGKHVLKNIEYVSKLFTSLTGSTEGLLKAFKTTAVSDIQDMLSKEAKLSPLPPQPPPSEGFSGFAMAFFNQTNQAELHNIFEFLDVRIKRDVLLVDTAFSDTPQSKQQYLSNVMDKIIRELVTDAWKRSDANVVTNLQEEARLSPRSKRRQSARTSDAIAFHLTLMCALLKHTQELRRSMAELFEDDADATEFLDESIKKTFAFRETYITSGVECELLKRCFAQTIDEHMRGLIVISADTPYDVSPTHSIKFDDLLRRTEEAVERAKVLCPTDELATVVLKLWRVLMEATSTFLAEELKKALDSIKYEASFWSRKAKSPEYYIKPPLDAPHLCGTRMILWAQQVATKLSRFCATHIEPLQTQNSTILAEAEQAKVQLMREPDSLAETLLTFCLHAVVTKSLYILLHEQRKSDFRPKVGEDKMLVATPSPACAYFCSYLSTQLQEIALLLAPVKGLTADPTVESRMDAPSSLHLRTPSLTRSDSVATANTAGDASVAPLPPGTPPPAQNDAVGVNSAVVSKVVSPLRLVGTALFHGICAHLRQFIVNDAGALVYKNDVTAYHAVMAPITSVKSLDGEAIAAHFESLKETANLLLVPLDNILPVKNSGFLRFMPNDEKQLFIRMREDVRSAFRHIDS